MSYASANVRCFAFTTDGRSGLTAAARKMTEAPPSRTATERVATEPPATPSSVTAKAAYGADTAAAAFEQLTEALSPINSLTQRQTASHALATMTAEARGRPEVAAVLLTSARTKSPLPSLLELANESDGALRPSTLWNPFPSPRAQT